MADKRSDDLVPVEDAVHDLDESYLLCRDVHHAWTVDGYRTGGGGTVERTLTCPRCGTERVDEWTMSGARVGAHYRYPDGYQFRSVDWTESPQIAVRREVLKRAGVTGRPTRRRRSR